MDLVGNPEDWFSHDKAHFMVALIRMHSDQHLYCLLPRKYQAKVSLVVRNSVFGVYDQVRHKPGCTTTEDG